MFLFCVVAFVLQVFLKLLTTLSLLCYTVQAYHFVSLYVFFFSHFKNCI